MGSAYSAPSGQPARPLLLPHPRVNSDKGPIEGFRHQLPDGRSINVFLGIPFAKPPLGELRFKKPQEPDAWCPRVLCAKRYQHRSVQTNFLWDAVELRVGISEDCLYLNVIAPGWSNGDRDGGFPVMLYIHGGAYLIDSAVKYHYKRVARTLVCHGVIVVTVQYRLGLFGFFCTADASCPGNLGLWDQLSALRWTVANIRAFGGDPQRLTVFGQSAGAASADLLSLSPLSRDLFSQSILMAGSAECVWAVSSQERVAIFCRKWAVKLGFPAEQPAEEQWDEAQNERMLSFLREIPENKFVLNMVSTFGKLLDSMGQLPLSPVVDGELLPVSPKQLRNCCLPRRVMAGLCKYEGMLFLALGLRRANTKLLRSIERQVSAYFDRPQENEQNGLESTEEGVLSGTAALDMYGIGEAMRANRRAVASTCVTMMSDFCANIGLHNFCKHLLPNGSTLFRFVFEHFNPDNTISLNPFFPFKGATHSNARKRTEVLSMVTKLWTNFAKYGDPNGVSSDQNPLSFRWSPIDQKNMERHLCIGSMPRMVETGGPDGRRVDTLSPVYRMHVQ